MSNMDPDYGILMYVFVPIPDYFGILESETRCLNCYFPRDFSETEAPIDFNVT